MKNQLKNYLRIFVLLIGLSALLWNCEKEEEFEIIETNQITNNFDYKTITTEELSKIKAENNFFSKSKNKLNLQLDFYDIEQKSIENTNEYATIIAATTKHKNINTDVMLIKYKDSIVRVLINMIPDKKINTKRFSGIMSITHLNGKFINGYRIKNGLFLSQFTKVNKTKNTSIVYKPDPDGCDESLDPDSIFCDDTLDEVIITGGGGSGSYSVNIPPGAYMSDYSTYDFGYGNGGGGSSSNSSGKSVDIFPCDNPIHGCDKEAASIVKPHFSSFEYSKPLGANYAGCGVIGINNTFYAYSSSGVHVTTIVFDTMYFSMPMWINNGVAATKTAEALDIAFEATENWYSNNPNALEAQVSFHISQGIVTEMKKIGGNASSIKSPFPILNPAPYVTDFFYYG